MAEYGIVVLILVVIMAAGILAGLSVGLVLALILFVVSYSRVRVVKHALSGANYSSNVDRPRRQRRTLRQRGHWLYILELQGFIFFATASSVLDQVRTRIANLDLPPPRFVVIDFRAVNGLDASAVLGFAKLRQSGLYYLSMRHGRT